MTNANINIIRKGATCTASAHLPYRAYLQAQASATAHGGEIVDFVDPKTNQKRFRATFDEVENAKKFIDEWRAAYAEAHAAYVPKSERDIDEVDAKADRDLAWLERGNTEGVKLFTGKGKGNSKPMTLNDFVIANPACTKAEAKAYGFKGTRDDLKALKKSLGVR